VKRGSFHLPLLLAVIVAALVAVLPSEVFSNGDAMAMRAGAIRLLDQGRIDVPPGYAENFGERGQYFYQRESDQRWHSKYGIANTLIYLPPLAIERAVTGELRHIEDYRRPGRARRAAILALYNIPIAAALAVYLFLMAGLFVESRAIASGFVLATLFSSFVFYYLRAQTPEIFQVLFFTGVCYHLARCRRADPSASIVAPVASRHAYAAIGFACLLVLQKMPYVWLLPLVAVFLVCADYRSDSPPLAAFLRGRIASAWPRLCIRIGIPVCATLGWIAFSNWVSFGSVLATGYDQWGEYNDPFGGNLYEGLRGFLIDPQKSVFLHFPLLLLAVFYWRAFHREHSFEAWFILLAFVPILIVYASTISWRGNWSYGPRYLVFAMPVLCLPVLSMLRAAKPWKSLSLACAVALVLGGLITQPMMVVAHFMLPVQVMARFQQVDAKEGEYFQRSWWRINRELFAFQTGQPFAPLERARSHLPASDTEWLAKEIRQLAVPNLYWADRERRVRQPSERERT
jgi:hypothetical protein